jgi:hypothetical protein
VEELALGVPQDVEDALMAGGQAAVADVGRDVGAGGAEGESEGFEDVGRVDGPSVGAGEGGTLRVHEDVPQ